MRRRVLWRLRLRLQPFASCRMSLLLLNKALAGVTFSLIAGSPFSQRCRCALAYTIAPGLSAFVIHRLFNGVDLLSELTFYSKYHMDPRNVFIHVIFVPLILYSLSK